MKQLQVFIALFFIFCGVHAQQAGPPAMAAIPGDFADPSVILVDGVYYAVGTSSEWAPHFPIFKSTDLRQWQQIGHAFNKKPAWASSSFWAPELFYNNGKFLLYYVARRAKDNVSCIALAVSEDPAKGFSDLGVILETGKEAIDPFVFRDGPELYISWKAYGLDKRPIELLAASLSANGEQVRSKPVTLLTDDAGKGIEGQSIIKRGDYYYLFYSAGNCCGSACSYNVRVARSGSVNGPYINSPSNPVINDDDQWKCPGHGTFVESNDGIFYYLYHAYRKTDDVFTGRQALLAKVSWKADWPVFEKVTGEVAETSWTDNFESTELSPEWQWDYRNAAPVTVFQNGELCLSGSIDTTKNATGTMLGVRPSHGDYVVTATVTNPGSALKGLVVYGDAGESFGVGIAGSNIELWNTHQNKRSVLKRQATTATGEVRFRIVSANTYKFRFYWSSDGLAWNEIRGGSSFVDGRHLPQWDRSPRAGIHVRGHESDQACFSSFSIDYK